MSDDEHDAKARDRPGEVTITKARDRPREVTITKGSKITLGAAATIISIFSGAGIWWASDARSILDKQRQALEKQRDATESVDRRMIEAVTTQKVQNERLLEVRASVDGLARELKMNASEAHKQSLDLVARLAALETRVTALEKK